MEQQEQQSYKHHARWHAPFHFFLGPVQIIMLVVAFWSLVRSPSLESVWLVVLTMAFIVNTLLTRLYALKVQDRVIRLEERLRMDRLLQPGLRAQAERLTEGQLVALRFAPDEELPELVEKTIQQGWTPKQIKQAIRQWRPDRFRV